MPNKKCGDVFKPKCPVGSKATVCIENYKQKDTLTKIRYSFLGTHTESLYVHPDSEYQEFVRGLIFISNQINNTFEIGLPEKGNFVIGGTWYFYLSDFDEFIKFEKTTENNVNGIPFSNYYETLSDVGVPLYGFNIIYRNIQGNTARKIIFYYVAWVAQTNFIFWVRNTNLKTDIKLLSITGIAENNNCELDKKLAYQFEYNFQDKRNYFEVKQFTQGSKKCIDLILYVPNPIPFSIYKHVKLIPTRLYRSCNEGNNPCLPYPKVTVNCNCEEECPKETCFECNVGNIKCCYGKDGKIIKQIPIGDNCPVDIPQNNPANNDFGGGASGGGGAGENF